MRLRGRTHRVALAVSCLGLLVGCSGIPSSSSPEVIRTVPNGAPPPAAQTISPQPSSDPRTIVSDFLRTNLGVDSHHTAARGFLAPDARNRWTDTTVTVVDNYTVKVFDTESRSVTLTANQLGSLDQRGVYTPVLTGDGFSGTPFSVSFGMQRVGGQWRIGQLQNGLLVDSPDFASTYSARPIYFLDQAQKRLVPDLRYSALSDQPLCDWILQQLVNPPRTELQSAVTSNLPAQTAHASVSFRSSLIVVNLPGINQVDGQPRVALAAQLASSFDINFTSSIEITDGSRLITVPDRASPFTAAGFESFASSGTQPEVYYLQNGAVVDGNGVALAGPVGTTNSHLSSVAIASSAAGPNLVAGVAGPPAAERLLLGNTKTGLVPTGLQAAGLSRPAWAPGFDEVWVGLGSGIDSVSAKDSSISAVPTAGRSNSTGKIKAVSFSPDGVRIALVIAPGDGTSQIWVGSVVRSGQLVRVDGLVPVTPIGLVLTDVAWNDDKTLYTIGTDVVRPGTSTIWSVLVDGSSLNIRSAAGLPGVPDAIAAAPNSPTWVSAQSAVWEQAGSTWGPPGTQTATISGTAPTYLQ